MIHEHNWSHSFCFYTHCCTKTIVRTNILYLFQIELLYYSLCFLINNRQCELTIGFELKVSIPAHQDTPLSEMFVRFSILLQYGLRLNLFGYFQVLFVSMYFSFLCSNPVSSQINHILKFLIWNLLELTLRCYLSLFKLKIFFFFILAFSPLKA